MIRRIFLVLIMLAGVAGCAKKSDSLLLGTLEWDRIGVIAEVTEPIVEVTAVEGDSVQTGDLILSLDARRTNALLDQAQAEVRRLDAQLAKLRQGARSETIDAAQATLKKAEAAAANAQRERKRRVDLRQRGLIAQTELDQAETAWRVATAEAAATRANLAELTHGTRREDLDQAEAALAVAQAQMQQLTLTKERLTVRAPRDGKVDALPFKLGDQPPMGATLVSLLTGAAPYARVYVPASQRVHLAPGISCSVQVQSISAPFSATLRSIRSDPAFTPYYALTGDDASQLVYRAELVLQGDAAKQLPAGLPIQAECAQHGG